MRNPWDELRAWCDRDRGGNRATFDVDENGRPRVWLHSLSTGFESTGIGATYDDALMAALDALPAEVRT